MDQIEAARSFLKGRGWLAETPARFADALLARCALRTATRGEIVYRLGEAPDGLRGGVSGGFAFEIAPHERGPNFAHLFRPGFRFGEAELFDGRPKIATIAVVESAAAGGGLDAAKARPPSAKR